ncbi:ATP-binding cassette domain-containing protein [Fundicoccus sp. Sow4_F4]|uniref:ATP-binding cassette domain-containing protein n=1 Tax=Fundicoccus sp. Sow4_F4 TaxID=3438783 RepID=UPI003F930CB0
MIRLGFDHNQVHLPLKTLSGGEATRIALARVFAKPSNILILDEPTNFIDLNTREALEDFIIAYPGTVLLVSHDRYFVEKVADHLYKIEDTQLKLIK